jgi:hypothetical protein
MPAAYQNLYVEQGSTFSTTIALDDVYGEAYNLTGYTANSEIRKSYYSSNTTAVFSTSISPAEGTITLLLTSAVTSNISPGRYVYDTIITGVNSDSVTRVLEGVVDVSPGVTR